jgi:hypothetical protein
VQRSVLAGGAVVFAAVVLAAIFWTGGEDAETAAEISQQNPEPEAAEAEAPDAGAAQDVTIQEVVRATEEGAQRVESETASKSAESSEAEGQIAALPPDAAPPLMAPQFDIVRVEPNGEAVIAGRSEPGSVVVLLDGEEAPKCPTAAFSSRRPL